MIAESAIEFEHEVEDQEEVVEKFKDFLDQRLALKILPGAKAPSLS